MDRCDEDRLTKNHIYLLENLDCVNVLDYLFQERIITIDHCERISAQTTSRDKNRTFLKIIKTRGPMAYKKFVQGLEQTTQSYIKDKLEEMPAKESDETATNLNKDTKEKEKHWLYDVIEERQGEEVNVAEIRDSISLKAFYSNEWMTLSEENIINLVKVCFPNSSCKKLTAEGETVHMISGIILKTKTDNIQKIDTNFNAGQTSRKENDTDDIMTDSLTPMENWTEEEVVQWFEKLGLDENVIDRLKKERLDGELLCHITLEELKSEILEGEPYRIRKKIIIKRDEYQERQKSVFNETRTGHYRKTTLECTSLPADDGSVHYPNATYQQNKEIETKSANPEACYPTEIPQEKSKYLVQKQDENCTVQDQDSSTQPFRDFNTRVTSSFRYKKHAKFPSVNARSDDPLDPIHHYADVQFEKMTTEEASTAFVAEVLRFACGCMNDRTNGTLHFGVSSSHLNNGEIEGLFLHQPLKSFSENLMEGIRNSFHEDQQEAVQSCLKPPHFIQVDSKGHSPLYVIEVDIVPDYDSCQDNDFWVKIPTFNTKKRKTEYGKLGLYRYLNGDFQMMHQETLPIFMGIKGKIANHRKDKERMEKQFDRRSSSDIELKLKELLCKGSDSMSGDIYPLLVINAPETELDMEENFSFIKELGCKAVFDFDSKARICHYIDTESVVNIVASTDQFDPTFKEHKDDQRSVCDEIKNSIQIPWIFTNGYDLLSKHRKVLTPLQWKEQRSQGMKDAIQFFRWAVPRERALVIFLILSSEYEVMLECVDEFITWFSEQWIFITESQIIAEEWIKRLVQRNVMDEEKLRDRTVVGMEWPHIQETVRHLKHPQILESCFLPTSQGHITILKESDRARLTDLDILSAKQCENSTLIEDKEALAKFLNEVETNFYCGSEVSWWNYWSQSHVLVRSQHNTLKHDVELALQRDVREERRVGTVFLYHQPGAGGTTAARQVLWDYRDIYRCAVVTSITEETPHQIIKFSEYGNENPSPVLLLLDNQDEDQVNCLLKKLEEQAKRTNSDQASVLYVFLICIRQMQVKKMSNKRVVIRHELKKEEQQWFERKYKQLEENHFKNEGEDPHLLISFNILKENFSESYIIKTAKAITDTMVRPNERRILKYVALLNAFDLDHQAIPTAAFDPVMMTLKEMYTGRPRYGPRAYDPRWESNLSPEMNILLNQTQRKSLGRIQAVSIISPLLSRAILNALSKGETVSNVTEELLTSRDIFENTCVGTEQLKRIVQNVLKHRRLGEDGKKEWFSPLIKEILENESIDRAIDILQHGYHLTEDPFVAQQIARVYIDAQNWKKATEYAEKATDKSPHSSALWDTQAQVFKKQLLTELMTLTRADNVVMSQEMVNILEIAFKSIELFKKEQQVSEYEPRRMITTTSLIGYKGEVEVTTCLLQCLHYVHEFQSSPEVLRRFLNREGSIPDSLLQWQDIDGINYLEKIWALKQNVEFAITRLDDECLQLKEECFDDFSRSNSPISEDKLTKLKENLDFYYGEDSNEVMECLSLNEKVNFRRRRVTRLCGITMRHIFDLIRAPGGDEKLEVAQKLLKDNLCQAFNNANDIQRLISINIALLRINADKYMPSIQFSSTNTQNQQENMFSMVSLSRRLYELRATQFPIVSLEPYLFFVMFNWPRNNTDVNWHQSPSAINQAMFLWSEAYFKKYPRQKTQDKPYRKKDTCMFFFATGKDMKSIAYYEDIKVETPQGSSAFWNMCHVKEKLKRFEGTLCYEGEEIEMDIRYGEGNRATLTIPTSLPIRDRNIWNRKVYFFIGFTWRSPKAYDVRLDDPTKSDDVIGAKSQMQEHQISQHKCSHTGSRNLLQASGSRAKKDRIEILQQKLVSIESIKKKRKKSKQERDMLKKEKDLQAELERLKGESDM